MMQSRSTPLLVILFGDMGKGVLARAPYLRFSAVVAGTFAIGTAACGAYLKAFSSLDASEIDRNLPAYAPFLACAMLLGPLLLFTIFNLTAKRARDIGLPGWPLIVLIVLLYIGLPPSPILIVAFTLMVWVIFAATPSDILGRRMRIDS